MIDHLVYATPDLEATVAALGSTWGISLVPGGPHLGRGTRNYLAGLGNGTYLEVIGPDPDQPTPAGPRSFGVDDLTDERLVTWCARPQRPLAEVTERARAAGYDMGPIIAMSRRRPDGVLLEWKLTVKSGEPNPLIPFCIDWGTTPHPSESLSNTTTLRTLRFTDADTEVVTAVIAAIGEDVEVQLGPTAIEADLVTPRGLLTLRSR